MSLHQIIFFVLFLFRVSIFEVGDWRRPARLWRGGMLFSGGFLQMLQEFGAKDPMKPPKGSWGAHWDSLGLQQKNKQWTERPRLYPFIRCHSLPTVSRRFLHKSALELGVDKYITLSPPVQPLDE